MISGNKIGNEGAISFGEVLKINTTLMNLNLWGKLYLLLKQSKQ